MKISKEELDIVNRKLFNVLVNCNKLDDTNPEYCYVVEGYKSAFLTFLELAGYSEEQVLEMIEKQANAADYYLKASDNNEQQQIL